MHRNVRSQRQCTGSWAQTPAPPDIKVDLPSCFAKQLHQESSKTGFFCVTTLIPGERGHVCMRISTYIRGKRGQISDSYWLGRTIKNVLKSYSARFRISYWFGCKATKNTLKGYSGRFRKLYSLGRKSTKKMLRRINKRNSIFFFLS